VWLGSLVLWGAPVVVIDLSQGGALFKNLLGASAPAMDDACVGDDRQNPAARSSELLRKVFGGL